MRRAILGLLAGLVGLMIGVSVPVMAVHVTEPTAPVTMARLELYKYGERGTTLLSACDGSEVVTFENMRVETFIAAAVINENPSEHFDEKVTLVKVTNLGQSNESEALEWEAFWRHSNLPPHARRATGTGWESSQNAQRLGGYADGTVLRFKEQVVGLESGTILNTSCTFTVG